jgi:hypothetical protein
MQAITAVVGITTPFSVALPSSNFQPSKVRVCIEAAFGPLRMSLSVSSSLSCRIAHLPVFERAMYDYGAAYFSALENEVSPAGQRQLRQRCAHYAARHSPGFSMSTGGSSHRIVAPPPFSPVA